MFLINLPVGVTFDVSSIKSEYFEVQLKNDSTVCIKFVEGFQSNWIGLENTLIDALNLYLFESVSRSTFEKMLNSLDSEVNKLVKAYGKDSIFSKVPANTVYALPSFMNNTYQITIVDEFEMKHILNSPENVQIIENVTNHIGCEKLYLVRSQAGFKHAYRDYYEYERGTYTLEGYPKVYPSIVAFVEKGLYTEGLYTEVSCLTLEEYSKLLDEKERDLFKHKTFIKGQVTTFI